MAAYYVDENVQEHGYHEVHSASCSQLPHERDLLYLGEFSSCTPAIVRANTLYVKVTGCSMCATPCHAA